MSRSALETPMMRQFLAIKAEHPDAIVFYRMGDFYEMFLADAELAAPILDIALTTRDKGKSDAVPMCGVPVHSADGYVRRLAEAGHRVAICEQVEDPRVAARRSGSKGAKLVRREVVEVVTAGLVGDPTDLEAAREVSVAALVAGATGAGLAVLEASTGSFRATQVDEAPAASGLPATLLEELERVGPRELLLAEDGAAELAAALEARLPGTAFTRVAPESFEPGRVEARPDGFDPDDAGAASRAAAAILAYVGRHQPFALQHVARLRPYRLSDAMVLDAPTRAHLELFESLEDRSRRGTLLERLDLTVTPLGARRLARWVGYPLLDPAAIGERQDAVARLAEDDRRRARLREALAPVRDLERLLSRAGRPTATPRDLAALRAAAAALPGVAAALAEPDPADLAATPAPALLAAPAPVPAVVELLEQALVDDPPVVARGSRGAQETGYVRAGFRPELDALREAGRKGREWVAGLEVRERERTGIPTLKARFHPVHGYSLEVTKANLARVPEDWERKQTLANAERFTTAELREHEAQIRGSTERAAALEREIFESVRQAVIEHAAALRAAGERVAELDALAALAEVARRDGWVRPEVEESRVVEIEAGRHPVVEPMLRRRSGEEFVPNDVRLDGEDCQILLLTGPNMSGKSTYLRQTALLVLLAQIGSFVPAARARIGVVDRIFTRVGASDRLARGESTFMVEMRETAEILAQASPRSLVILDEIGRGTSTYDGLSIAWAVAEYLHDTPGLGARTLFATHYHELADLARTRARVHNAHFEAREWGEEVIFLRRLAAGEASRSYGIQVARLAGLPALVIQRAQEILSNLESGEFDAEGRPRLAEGDEAATPVDQLSLFDAAAREGPGAAVLEELAGVDPDRLAPLDALLLVRRLRASLRGEEEAP